MFYFVNVYTLKTDEIICFLNIILAKRQFINSYFISSLYILMTNQLLSIYNISS